MANNVPISLEVFITSLQKSKAIHRTFYVYISENKFNLDATKNLKKH